MTTSVEIKPTPKELLFVKDYTGLVAWVKGNYLNCPNDCYEVLCQVPLDSEGLSPVNAANVHNLKGIIEFNKGKYYEANEFFKQAMEIAKLHELKELMTKLLINFSSICIRYNRNKEAIKYAYDSLKYHYPKFNAMAYQNLGTLYSRIGESEKAYECQLKSFEINTQIGEEVLIHIDLTNLGSYHVKNGDYEKALEFFHKNVDHCEKYSLNVSMIGAMSDLAKTYLVSGNNETSIEIAENCLVKGKKLENEREVLEVIAILVEAYFKIGNVARAKELIEEFKNYNDIPDCFLERKTIFETSIAIAELEADFEKALTISKAYNEYLKDLSQISAGEDFEDYIELREREIAEIRSRNETIEQRNKEITSISNLMAHDLKTPIRNINSFVELLEKKVDNVDPEVKDCIDFITNSSQELYQKLDLIEFYLNYNLKLPLVPIELKKILNNINSDILPFGASLIFSNVMPVLDSNTDSLYKLFSILISLAINNSTEQNAIIEIEYEELDNDHFIRLSDNKDGFKNAILSFKDFFKLVNKEDGAFEIGVALCRRIIFLHNGKMLYNSKNLEKVSLDIWLAK